MIIGMIKSKVAAMIIATVIPSLLYAHENERDHGRDWSRDCNHSIPVVPEANAFYVMIPFVGVVLLASFMRRRQKA
jgi:hypothetical protein